MPDDDDQVAYLLKCTRAQRKRWAERAKQSNMSLAAWIRGVLDAGPVLETKVEPKPC